MSAPETAAQTIERLTAWLDSEEPSMHPDSDSAAFLRQEIRRAEAGIPTRPFVLVRDGARYVVMAPNRLAAYLSAAPGESLEVYDVRSGTCTSATVSP